MASAGDFYFHFGIWQFVGIPYYFASFVRLLLTRGAIFHFYRWIDIRIFVFVYIFGEIVSCFTYIVFDSFPFDKFIVFAVCNGSAPLRTHIWCCRWDSDLIVCALHLHTFFFSRTIILVAHEWAINSKIRNDAENKEFAKWTWTETLEISRAVGHKWNCYYFIFNQNYFFYLFSRHKIIAFRSAVNQFVN